jgi:hypothetical protein
MSKRARRWSRSQRRAIRKRTESGYSWRMTRGPLAFAPQAIPARERGRLCAISTTALAWFELHRLIISPEFCDWFRIWQVWIDARPTWPNVPRGLDGEIFGSSATFSVLIPPARYPGGAGVELEVENVSDQVRTFRAGMIIKGPMLRWWSRARQLTETPRAVRRRQARDRVRSIGRPDPR